MRSNHSQFLIENSKVRKISKLRHIPKRSKILKFKNIPKISKLKKIPKLTKVLKLTKILNFQKSKVPIFTMYPKFTKMKIPKSSNLPYSQNSLRYAQCIDEKQSFILPIKWVSLYYSNSIKNFSNPREKPRNTTRETILILNYHHHHNSSTTALFDWGDSNKKCFNVYHGQKIKSYFQHENICQKLIYAKITVFLYKKRRNLQEKQTTDKVWAIIYLLRFVPLAWYLLFWVVLLENIVYFT